MVAIRDRRPKDWYWNQKLLVDHFGSLIGVNGVAVYDVLSRHADGNSQQTFISISRISELLATSEATVRRTLRTLKSYRLVYVTESKKGDQYNLYTLLDLAKSATAMTPKLFDDSSPTPVTGDKGTYQLLVSDLTPVTGDPCQRQGCTPVKNAIPYKEEQDCLTRLTTSTTVLGDQSPILKAMLRWLPSVDQELLERLIRDCLSEAPDASAQDIAYFVEQKGPGLYLERPTADGFRREPKPDIRSPGGFLVAAVRKCFRGEAYRDYRQWADQRTQSSA